MTRLLRNTFSESCKHRGFIFSHAYVLFVNLYENENPAVIAMEKANLFYAAFYSFPNKFLDYSQLPPPLVQFYSILHLVRY